ncbi:helix-turn-helix domain-containing protein [Sunxiuqinia elliptica]|uniref:DNA binding domain-containing protein, excisionase family n=1 Tax=Sunxiuqinia elliptica TaxID=655355 RepID=A0A1I2F2G2_9BACT|nr:helix-turn-helix domain-containing protein [Sunxiuqinia elliptica]SFE98711.1 DNA binding domain-containing protein, excisionase family [Sunxiuqinia elliptica]
MEQIFLQGINVRDFKQLLEDTVEQKFKILVQCDEVLNNSVQRKSRTYLSRIETAKILKVSLPTLNEWTKQGIISAYRIGNRILYKPDEIEESLKQVCNLKYKRG